jgi:hypothetical protein
MQSNVLDQVELVLALIQGTVDASAHIGKGKDGSAAVQK